MASHFEANLVDQNKDSVIFLWANPGLFYCLFLVFSNKPYYNYNKYIWKNVHPVYGAGIWTHALHNMSLLP